MGLNHRKAPVKRAPWAGAAPRAPKLPTASPTPERALHSIALSITEDENYPERDTHPTSSGLLASDDTATTDRERTRGCHWRQHHNVDIEWVVVRTRSGSQAKQDTEYNESGFRFPDRGGCVKSKLVTLYGKCTYTPKTANIRAVLSIVQGTSMVTGPYRSARWLPVIRPMTATPLTMESCNRRVRWGRKFWYSPTYRVKCKIGIDVVLHCIQL